ncbi:hypothetical protein TCAL_01418 [Tigriopus californicus]|uniref:Translation initiation factor eIF2B subunit alpha n=1 Tax=Tigriopus californicus TaxID=6832 RepID=A0A553NUE5_TIGCA|nr:translation initiation factor eIF-2B subunit alpha-like isoform X2 [Tigriopus californicus]TRY69033.1 hypothetical protein TCAL_01418 [Tigriopus californicus]|eukprot:TCALIF_01418-PA protein Name:"Similar to Eif2b1 Translation initiation factor eIF-2B subunit alpha (Mus musculus)" AED:0.08 eAED:0.08 QI:117/1/1/1/1/1/7/726/318
MSPALATSPSQDLGVDVLSAFQTVLKTQPELSIAMAAIRVLMQVLAGCRAGTIQELVELLRAATQVMKCKADCSSTSVVSGGELFLRFITLASEALEQEDNFENVRKIMMERGEQFLRKLSESRPKIAKLSAPFLRHGTRVLVHAHSKCVFESLKEVQKTNPEMHLYITESSLDHHGHEMKKSLDDLGFSTTLILDASIGYILGKMDFVLMGAEGVVETGGIINKIGSYTIALCAKALNKPVYVLCESFKFVRFYPLSQEDLPSEFKFYASTLEKTKDIESEHPVVDYTPPSLITLLFTDLGILTPSAVSDELIKLYL